MAQDIQLTRDGYQKLWDQLSQAHSTLPGSETVLRQQLRDKMDAVQDALDAFDRADIHTNTAAFEALKTKLTDVNTQLSTLKADIEKIADKVGVAAKVVAAINQAIAVEAKLLA